MTHTYVRKKNGTTGPTTYTTHVSRAPSSSTDPHMNYTNASMVGGTGPSMPPSFPYDMWSDWMRAHGHVWWILCAGYLCYVHNIGWTFGKCTMLPTWVSIGWNLGMFIFSTLGLVHLTQYAVTHYTTDPLRILSDETYMYSADVGWWIWAFILSKVPELFDTVLIKARGRRPIFLQWFHHSATMMYAWYIYTTRPHNSAGFMMAWLNYGVHSVMYLYFAVMIVCKSRFPALRNLLVRYSPLLTCIQVLQMFIVIGVYSMRIAYLHMAPDWYGMTMYGIYAVCFLRLFLEKVVRGPPHQKRV